MCRILKSRYVYTITIWKYIPIYVVFIRLWMVGSAAHLHVDVDVNAYICMYLHTVYAFDHVRGQRTL